MLKNDSNKYELSKNLIDNSDKTLKIIKYKVLSFPVSSNDSSNIGYPEESNYEIGPSSIEIDGDYVYIVDVLFDKIWKIDLLNETLTSNAKLNWKNKPWLRDIIVFNNKVYVTSDLTEIYKFSQDLELLNTFQTENNDKYFFEVGIL